MTDTGDRRSAARCPVCQGPTLLDETKPGGVRCRNSLCAQNHTNITCPRCEDKDVEPVEFKEDIFKYRCNACLHVFTRPKV